MVATKSLLLGLRVAIVVVGGGFCLFVHDGCERQNVKQLTNSITHGLILNQFKNLIHHC